jgi:FHA domain-containing protein
MAICSHCGRQSQANALNCEFCGYPLTTEESDISGRDTVFTSPPVADNQNGAQATTIEQHNDGPLAKVVVRPLQDSGVAPREYALTGQNVSIGRSPSCEIVLEQDQLTSRRHALLRYDGAQYTVVDLGSSNGTFVNDAEIRDATPLNHGDRIIVGEHELMFSTSVAGMAPAASVELNGEPPSTPLGATGAQPVLKPDQFEDQQETAAMMASTAGDVEDADTAYLATAISSSESAPVDVADLPTMVTDVSDVSDVSDVTGISEMSDMSDVSDVTDVSDVSDISDVADVSAAADVSDVTDASEVADMSDVAIEAEDARAPESETAGQLSSSPLPPPSTPDSLALLARAPSSGALSQPGGELDQLRAQLAQLAATSEQVAQHAEEETNLSEQRRQALAETRDHLHAILAGIQNASSQTPAAESEDSGDLTDLIALTQQAAADPNHLQNVSRLAEHANDIARALEALQAKRIQPPRPSAEENALAELRALQARLDELA